MENPAMQANVRSQHKTLNTRLKNWGILGTTYCQNITKHGTVFYACDVIKSLLLQMESPYLRWSTATSRKVM
jgi:hypothetical protein